VLHIRMSVTQSANRQTAEQFPFTNAGSAEELYPPVCLRTHWDPTAMLRRVLPEQGKGQSLPLPLDFRPYVKVCQNYVTSAPAEEAPLPPANVVFPMGGEFYPPGRYADAIDNESTLHYLDRRLDKWCQQKEWIPAIQSDMYVPNVMVQKTGRHPGAFAQELAMPQAVLREEIYACRSGDDKVNWDRSGRLFNNPTKQDRYGAQKYYALPGGKLPISHGESQPVPPTAQALRAAYAIPRPGGNGVSVDTAYGGIRPIYERPFEYPARIAGISAAANQAPA
jgi:hypothetical protein